MKKLSIGKIEENVNNSTMCYVELFEGRIKKEFDDKSKAFTYVSNLAKDFMSESSIDKLSIKFLPMDHNNHYIVFNKKILKNGQEIFVHEETDFEHKITHSMYYDKYVNRQNINTRSFSFLDILRKAVNWKPWLIRLLMWVLFINVIVSLAYNVSSLDLLNETNPTGLPTGIVYSYAIFSLTLVFPLIFAPIMIVFNNKINSLNEDFYAVNWKLWFFRRMTILLLVSLLLFAILFISIVQLKSLKNDEKKSIEKIYISGTIAIAWCSISLLFSIVMGIMSLVTIVVTSHKLLNKNERKKMTKWLFSHGENHYSSIKSNFFLDSKYSEKITHTEIVKTIEFMRKKSQLDVIVYKTKHRDAFEKSINNFFLSKKIQKYLN